MEKVVKQRPDFDEIFMELAENLALRSHCVKAQVGAVLTKDTRIISIGYNYHLLELIIAMRNFQNMAVHVTLKEVVP